MIYYNDNDAKCCAWLRELIAAKLITEGEVDETSITEIVSARLEKAHQAHFFAGIGGWAYALTLAGWPQDREVWTGSCPCQSFSVAGKRRGVKDARHLWPAWFRLIRQRQPATIFGEQVEGAIGHGWLDAVFADLEGEGYACGAAVLGAHSVSAPHRRQRIFWVGHAQGRARKVSVCARGSRQAVPEFGGDGGIGALGHAQAQRCGSCAGAHGAGCGERIQSKERRGVVGDTCKASGTVANGAGERCEYVQDKRSARLRGAMVQSKERRGVVGDLGAASGSVANGGRQEPQRMSAKTARRSNQRGQLGNRGHAFWSGCEWIPCRDGKFRAVEPGIFPLAHGLSSGVVPSGDPGESYVNEVGEARGMRLRGYGNAIVPQLAAEFIGAFLEAEHD